MNVPSKLHPVEIRWRLIQSLREDSGEDKRQTREQRRALFSVKCAARIRCGHRVTRIAPRAPRYAIRTDYLLRTLSARLIAYIRVLYASTRSFKIIIKKRLGKTRRGAPRRPFFRSRPAPINEAQMIKATKRI